MLSLCSAPPQGLCKAPHDSGVYWKQFMMLLEEVLDEAFSAFVSFELELELILSQMAQKPMLRG